MAFPTTHYERLGVSRGASAADLAAAYRDQLARLKTRPGVAAADVAALREAYQVLSTPARRAEYDKSVALPPGAWQKSAPRQAPASGGRSWLSGLFVLAGALVLIGIAAWGWNQRGKASRQGAQGATARPAAAPGPALAPVNPKLVVGKWRCDSPRDGGPAEHVYGGDGRVRIVSGDRDTKPHYRVVGRNIHYELSGQRNVMVIETLTDERMVQVFRLPDGRPAKDRVDCRRLE